MNSHHVHSDALLGVGTGWQCVVKDVDILAQTHVQPSRTGRIKRRRGVTLLLHETRDSRIRESARQTERSSGALLGTKNSCSRKPEVGGYTPGSLPTVDSARISEVAEVANEGA